MNFLCIRQVENEDESKEGDEWEYVEEGPAEIIWQGNEIIVKKKKVRVAKKDVDRQFNREVLLYYFVSLLVLGHDYFCSLFLLQQQSDPYMISSVAGY